MVVLVIATLTIYEAAEEIVDRSVDSVGKLHVMVFKTFLCGLWEDMGGI